MSADPARDRVAILLGLRIGGAVLVALGLYMWLGGGIAGGYDFGTILVVTGLIGSLLLPALLVRRWRTPR